MKATAVIKDTRHGAGMATFTVATGLVWQSFPGMEMNGVSRIHVAPSPGGGFELSVYASGNSLLIKMKGN